MQDATRPTYPTRPIPLREYLDAGGDFHHNDRVWWLAELAICDLRLEPSEWLQRRVHGLRSRVEMYLDSPDLLRAVVGSAQDMLNVEVWCADLIDDPSLADRVIAALPEAEVERHRELFDKMRRSHPLVVGEHQAGPGGWRCANCGAAYLKGERAAIWVTDREGWSELEDHIPYCADCIEMALAVAKVSA